MAWLGIQCLLFHTHSLHPLLLPLVLLLLQLLLLLLLLPLRR